MTKAKVFTIINYVLSAIGWLLGILTLLFNILGLWDPWHLAGFGFMFYIPVPIISQFLAIFFCNISEKKLLMLNLIPFIISISFALLTVLVSTRWFW